MILFRGSAEILQNGSMEEDFLQMCLLEETWRKHSSKNFLQIRPMENEPIDTTKKQTCQLVQFLHLSTKSCGVFMRKNGRKIRFFSFFKRILPIFLYFTGTFVCMRTCIRIIRKCVGNKSKRHHLTAVWALELDLENL
jgi:hypothetical protein